MYTLVSAVAKTFSSQGRWESVDISQLTFQQIYTTYIACVATLTNPFLDAPVAFDVIAYEPTVGNSNETFTAFLTANGNSTLPTVPVPVLNTQYTEYRDAFRAGFTVQPVGPTQAPDYPLPLKDKTWLYLQKSGVNYQTIYENCLCTVNGYIHRLDYSTQGLWVVDGMKSLFKSNCNQIGLLNFQNVSSFTVVPITADMIYKQSSSQLYQNQMYINVGQDISQKVIGLVLGGYLHIFDPKTFYKVGLTQIAIDFGNFPLFERYHESRPYLDYSALPFERTQNNWSQVSVPNFLADANLAAYAQMSQSFIIIFDNPEMFRDDPEYVQSAHMPGMLVAYTKPKWPLINGIGKLADYFSVFEDRQWSLHVHDNFWQRRVYDTVPLATENGIADARRTDDPVRHSRAYFLKIGTDLPPAGSPAAIAAATPPSTLDTSGFP